MPLPTTYDALRADIVTAIRGIQPSYQPMAESLWCVVQDEDDVPSTDARNYFVDLAVPSSTGEVYGGCLEHEAELRIVTSYGGLSSVEGRTLAARDSQDLWTVLHRIDDGSPRFEYDEFTDEAEDGRLWGAHVFTVTFFLPLQT